MKNLLPQPEFLGKYNIVEEEFAKTKLKWGDLEAIFSNYLPLKPELESIGETLSNRLMKINKVHSVRYRVKDEEHLIEKIIRKRLEKPEREIDLSNYLVEITDLVGLRAIHLFKEDWDTIHEAIREIWELKDNVKAYVRAGDNESYQKSFSDKGLDVAEHKFGYRSIHYIIRTKPANVLNPIK